MNGSELLSILHAPETLHRAFASPERQVRVLNPVIEPPARLLFFGSTKLSESSPIRCEAIRDYGFRFSVTLHQFPEKFQCSSFIFAFGDNGFQHLTS